MEDISQRNPMRIFVEALGYHLAVSDFANRGNEDYSQTTVQYLAANTFAEYPIHTFNTRLEICREKIAKGDKKVSALWLDSWVYYTLTMGQYVNYDNLRKLVQESWDRMLGGDNENILNELFEGTKPELKSNLDLFMFCLVSNIDEIALIQASYGAKEFNPVNGKPHLMPVQMPPVDPNAGKPR